MSFWHNPQQCPFDITHHTVLLTWHTTVSFWHYTLQCPFEMNQYSVLLAWHIAKCEVHSLISLLTETRLTSLYTLALPDLVIPPPFTTSPAKYYLIHLIQLSGLWYDLVTCWTFQYFNVQPVGKPANYYRSWPFVFRSLVKHGCDCISDSLKEMVLPLHTYHSIHRDHASAATYVIVWCRTFSKKQQKSSWGLVTRMWTFTSWNRYMWH